MSAFVGLLAFGSVGFWVFLVAFTILFWALLEVDKLGWATTSTVVALFLFSHFGNFDLMHVIRANPIIFVELVILHFLVGVLWATAKWFFHVRNRANKFRDGRNEWMRQRNIRRGTILDREQREQMFTDNYMLRGLAVRPKAKDNKARIFAWMVYWPWSMSWSIVNDPVIWIWKQLFVNVARTLDNIAKRLYRDIDTA